MRTLLRKLRRPPEVEVEVEPAATPAPLGPVVPDEPVDMSTVDVWRATRLPDAGPHPWLDEPDAHDEVDRRHKAGALTDTDADLCHRWIDNGYVIVKGLIDDATLDEAWFAYETAIQDGVVTLDPEKQAPEDSLPGRFLNPHFRVPALKQLMEDERLVHIVELLFGAKAVPFQTITGHKASQQAVHSDSIHMTTYPTGYLIANWIAFEDIEADSGPLEYFPGTHRLPVLYSDEIGIPENALEERGYQPFDELYTPRIEALTDEHADRRSFFTARKGDVLFWHANLLHGGSPRTNFTRSRRALVCHYFAEGCICYHDYSGTLSWLHPQPPPS